MKEKFIRIGSVEIPLLDYVISGNAILGIRDSGKTVTAKGIAEQMLDAGIPWIVFDAVGKWQWLKVARNGAGGKAYKIVVVGGRNPDLPLNTHSVGEVIRAAIKENIPLVIDLYDPKLSKGDWRKIVQESIRIIHYENEGLRHVFLEEAAEYVPQRVNDFVTYGEVEKFVRMGGNASVGVTIINQRSQEVNKAVLDLCHNLVLGCQVGSKAIEAVEKWVDRLSPEIAERVTTSLPHLKPGEAWVWTKGNPDQPYRIQAPMCRSYHPDRRNPDVQSLPKSDAANPDQFVAKLKDALPKIAEELKANDPAELKRTIAELKRTVQKLEQKAPVVQQAEAKEVPVFTKSNEAAIDKLASKFDALRELQLKHQQILEERFKVVSEAKQLVESLKLKPFFKFSGADFAKPGQPSISVRFPLKQARDRVMPERTAPVSVDGVNINSVQQRILDAIAWFDSIGTQNPTGLQVGAVALIDSTGGYFSNMVGPLCTGGLVNRGNGRMSLTDAGRKVAQVPDSISTMADYHDMLRERVKRARNAGGPTVKILDCIICRKGQHISVEEIGREVGIDHTGGYFSNMIGPLSTLGLIERSRGYVMPTEVLFPPGIV